MRHTPAGGHAALPTDLALATGGPRLVAPHGAGLHGPAPHAGAERVTWDHAVPVTAPHPRVDVGPPHEDPDDGRGEAPESAHDAARRIWIDREDARRPADRVARRQLGVRLRWGARVALAVGVDAAIVAGVAAAVARLGPNGPAEALVVVVTLLALANARWYRPAERHAGAAPLGGALCVAAVAVSAATMGSASLAPLFATLACAGAVLLGVREFSRHLLEHRSAPRVALSRTVLVGGESDTAPVYLALEEAFPDAIHEVISSDHRGERGRAALASRLRARLVASEIREVVVATPLRARRLRAVAATCWRAGARCLVAFDSGETPLASAVPVRLGSVLAWELVPEGITVPSLPIKRLLDVVITALALVVAVPLAAFVAVAIRLDSRGPVFFRQRRVGLGGREFTIWKFRSMRSEDIACREELARFNRYGDAPLFKLRGDPRITRVGRLLRRTSLDELPQLINVLRGEMSLVGPRPPLPEEVSRYSPHHYVRLAVTPGITGPWQVGGRNLITDFERIVQMEREYIERWSLALDMRILVQTVGVVVRGTGAF